MISSLLFVVLFISFFSFSFCQLDPTGNPFDLDGQWNEEGTQLSLYSCIDSTGEFLGREGNSTQVRGSLQSDGSIRGFYWAAGDLVGTFILTPQGFHFIRCKFFIGDAATSETPDNVAIFTRTATGANFAQCPQSSLVTFLLFLFCCLFFFFKK